jgi:hypothetical protein
MKKLLIEAWHERGFLIICFILGLILWLVLSSQSRAATRVWLMYGWGDNAFGSSRGIDEIAARARTIPGVVHVNVRNYWDTTTIYNEILAAPANDRIVLGGYSCGANSATVVARALWQVSRKVHTIANIQMSLWCGGDALESNVKYGQSTYNADCRQTLGLGCKPLQGAPSFAGVINNTTGPIHMAMQTTTPLPNRMCSPPSRLRLYTAMRQSCPHVQCVTVALHGPQIVVRLRLVNGQPAADGWLQLSCAAMPR